MIAKPTYEELEQRIKVLEKEALRNKQMEQELKSEGDKLKALLNEEIYRNIIYKSPVGISIYDESGQCVEANDSIAKIVGATKEQVLQQNYNNIESWKKSGFLDKAKEAIREQSTKRHELITESTFGKVVRLDCHLVPFDSGGLLLMTSDITGPKITEEELRKYERIVSSASDHLAMFDKNYIYLTINDAYTISQKKKRNEIIGHSVPELFGREFFEKNQKPHIDRCLAGETVRYQLWISLPASGRRYMDVVHRPYYDNNGEILGSIVYARDITEGKIAEDALQESEEKYRELVENINDVIYEIDKTGLITYISPAIESILGYRPQELIGRSFAEYIYKEDLPRIMKRFEEILSGIVELSEYRVLSKSGETHWVRSSSRPVFKEDQVVGLRGMLSDVTEAKLLQNQLQQAQKMEAIGTLAGGIAHDFNNILSPILIQTEMALLDLPSDSLIRLNLEDVLEAGHRARGLVKQILAFSRQAEEERYPIQVRPVVEDALKLLRASLPTTIEIQQDFTSESDAVLADPTQIHQILMNLCTNASHAILEKGGVLQVRLDDVKFDTEPAAIADLSPGSYLRLTVSDTGEGMDRAVLDRIFDPYFTTKGKGQGTGLGLAVVHGIVKSYEGAITVDSKPGKGTVFEVYLPRVEGSGLAEADEVEPVPKGDETILLVDDEKAIIDAIQQALELLGYQVVARTSSIEALEVFRSRPDRVDLVITDQTMPTMTGEDLTRELMALRSDLPIILCTGFSEIINEKKAKAIGIREFIMKPVIMSEMAKKIRTVLDDN